MIEITKEEINSAHLMDKHKPKHLKDGYIKSLIKESKVITYLLGAIGIFTIANATLIYSFYKILIKL